MPMTQYTKEEKQAYYANLRKRWQEAKRIAETDSEAKALYQLHGGNYSFWSFVFVLIQMRAKKLDGIPYIDMRTFHGWRDCGFKVKKGEHSTADGIVWKEFSVESKTQNGDGEKVDAKELEESDAPVRRFPKVYKLFHKSQVEPI